MSTFILRNDLSEAILFMYSTIDINIVSILHAHRQIVTHQMKRARNNGTFVASLHVQIIYCLLVWTRYLKTCFQCIYIVSQMNWTKHVCLWIMFYVTTLHYCQKLKHYLIIHAIVSQFKWIMDWRCSGLAVLGKLTIMLNW